MAEKRKRDDEKDVDDFERVDEPILTANVHGVINSLSPIKPGRKSKYFDGTVTDGKSKLRVVGYSQGQQEIMDDLMVAKQPVELNDCEIKRARRGLKMEISLKGSTKITKSDKQFNMAAIEFADEGPPVVHLSQLDTRDVFDRVSVRVKVLKMMAPERVAGGKRVQEITVADGTGVGKVSIWEENIGILQENKCYLLENFFVREYAAAKFLSMGKEGSKVLDCEDIGEVVNDETYHDPDKELVDAQIIGVLKLDKYKACLRCKAWVEPSSPPLGKCSKEGCGMLQKYDVCQEQLSAKLMFQSGAAVVSVYAYGKMVKDLACVHCNEEVTEEIFLRVPMLTSVRYNHQNVITGFAPRTTAL